MAKIPYNKTSLTIDQQISLLEQRGIHFTDKKAAIRFLTYHNYYYVSGYVYYFEKKGEERTHTFSRPIEFAEISSLVSFDKRLRDFFFSAVQTIEIAVRSSISRNVSLVHGPFCFEKHDIFRYPDSCQKLLNQMDAAIFDRRNEPFIKHFSNTYSNTYPPVWVVIELPTFGTVSRIYNNLKTGLQKKIAADFDVDHFVLVSWLRAVTELRNTCAHHSRLWNKVFVNYPKIQNRNKAFPLTDKGNNRLGSFIPLMQYLLQNITASPGWQKKCLEFFEGNKSIRPEDLGLSRWWKDGDFGTENRKGG